MVTQGLTHCHCNCLTSFRSALRSVMFTVSASTTPQDTTCCGVCSRSDPIPTITRLDGPACFDQPKSLSKASTSVLNTPESQGLSALANDSACFMASTAMRPRTTEDLASSARATVPPCFLTNAKTLPDSANLASAAAWDRNSLRWRRTAAPLAPSCRALAAVNR